MKKSLFVLILIACSMWLPAQTVNTIGTGTSTQQQPFEMFSGYERSASLYTAPAGLIISLGWYVATANPVLCPVKIYIKQTSVSNLSSVKWSTMKANSTLVFNGSLSFNTTGWQTVDIADYANDGSIGSNIVVMCETNYGGIGAPINPFFRYSFSSGDHEYWANDDSTYVNYDLNGSVNANLPNIQITYYTLGTPVPPSGFLADAVSSSQVNLRWAKNAANDNVLIACNSTNTFGTPSGSYAPGDPISGGGTVIYNGSAATFSQESGLAPSTSYYYKAWSANSAPPVYSVSTGAQATTFCPSCSVFPYLIDFETAMFPPACWSWAGLPWSRSVAASGFGIGTGSVKADFFNQISGNFDLVSPDLDFSAYLNPVVTFDHAYATSNDRVDELQIWYAINNENTFEWLVTLQGGLYGELNTGDFLNSSFVPNAGQWASKSYDLPPGTTKVLFRGISNNGNNLYLDNISFHADCPMPEMPYATNIAATSAELGWTPSGPAGGWQIKWGNSGFNVLTAGTLITGVSSASYWLDGLQPGVGYDYYVQTDCGGGFSSWAGPVAFTTVCNTVAVPYTESFDNFSPPGTGCVAVTNNNGDAISWATSAAFSASPPNSMYISRSGSVDSDDWFFTPGMSLAGGVAYTLNFKYRGDGAGTSEKLALHWGTGPDAGSMTPGQLWSDPDIQHMTFINGSAVITPAVSGIVFFGWHCYSSSGTGFLCVDDISVDKAVVTWNGSVSGEWNDPANWTPAVVPNGFQHVIIPGSYGNAPSANVSGLACRNLTLSAGVAMVIQASGVLTVNGDLTIQPTAALDNQGVLILKGNLDNQNPQ